MKIDKKKFREDFDQFVGYSNLFTDKDRTMIKNRLHEENSKKQNKLFYPLALSTALFLVFILFLSSRYLFDSFEQKYTASDFIEMIDMLNIAIENRSSFDEIVQSLGDEYTHVLPANETHDDGINYYTIRYDFVINPSFVNTEIYDFVNLDAVKSGDLAGQIILSFNQQDQLYDFTIFFLNRENQVELYNNHNGKILHDIIKQE